jgi:hypothetical protein
MLEAIKRTEYFLLFGSFVRFRNEYIDTDVSSKNKEYTLAS